MKKYFNYIEGNLSIKSLGTIDKLSTDEINDLSKNKTQIKKLKALKSRNLNELPIINLDDEKVIGFQDGMLITALTNDQNSLLARCLKSQIQIPYEKNTEFCIIGDWIIFKTVDKNETSINGENLVNQKVVYEIFKTGTGIEKVSIVGSLNDTNRKFLVLKIESTDSSTNTTSVRYQFYIEVDFPKKVSGQFGFSYEKFFEEVITTNISNTKVKGMFELGILEKCGYTNIYNKTDSILYYLEKDKNEKYLLKQSLSTNPIINKTFTSGCFVYYNQMFCSILTTEDSNVYVVYLEYKTNDVFAKEEIVECLGYQSGDISKVKIQVTNYNSNILLFAITEDSFYSLIKYEIKRLMRSKAVVRKTYLEHLNKK